MNTDHINLTLRNRVSKEEGLAPLIETAGASPSS
jgi:hypothetical protein